jgi:hypothetical protein
MTAPLERYYHARHSAKLRAECTTFRRGFGDVIATVMDAVLSARGVASRVGTATHASKSRGLNAKVELAGVHDSDKPGSA